MKDVLPKQPPTPMAKVAIKKKDKPLSAKKTKEAKSTKVNASAKTNKTADKKSKPKGREIKRKKVEKKVPAVRKKNESTKATQKKNVKAEKPLKNVTEIGRKRKLAQNNYIADSESFTPVKIPKMNAGHCTTNKLVNGSARIMPPTTRNPCVLKLGLSPRPHTNSVTNGVASNGTLPFNNKSVLFIPKRNAVPNEIFNRNTSVPIIKKDETSNGMKFTKNVKNSAIKECKPDAEVLKKIVDFNQQHPVKGLEIAKKVEDSRKALFQKNSKPSCSKDMKSVNPKDTKSSSKDKNTLIPKDQTKIHPQRMASLDAMAKMHVICSTDRRSSLDTLKLLEASKECPESFAHRKTVTECSEKIQFGIQKEHLYHRRIVKVEESSVSERRENVRTISTASQQKEPIKKRPRGRPKATPVPDSIVVEKLNKSKQSAAVRRKNSKLPVVKEEKPKRGAEKKEVVKKGAKVPKIAALGKIIKKTKKAEQETKITKRKPRQKVEETKSKVKVKETIRLQKTCTYQSVTTVNSHETAKSVVTPCSRMGVMTNYSETKKTVVTDAACEKEKTDFSVEEVRHGPYCATTDSQCSPGHSPDCCRCVTHSPPQLIPFAHAQSCHGVHRTGESNSPQSPHCDGRFPVHRFGHQQHLVYPQPSRDCGCCCSNSLLQSIHDTCLLPKGINSCTHHLPSHSHLPSTSFANKNLCTTCHPGSTQTDVRHHGQHFNLPSSSHLRNSWCPCYDPCRKSNRHNQANGSCHQCPAAAKNTTTMVPCDQSPLDLSLATTSSTSVSSAEGSPSRTHCPSPFCCRDLVFFQTPTHSYQSPTPNANKPCCVCPSDHPPFEEQKSEFEVQEKPQLLQLTGNKAHHKMIHMVRLQQTTESPPFLASVSKSLASTVVSVAEGSSSSVVHQEVARADNFSYAATKQERNSSPRLQQRLSISKKRKFAHGWSWEGEPVERLIALTNDSLACPKKCYPTMRHKEGDIINERDCVLLRSGPKDTDLPYVAKVAAFWENPEDGEMMMSLLWYYRPEHTEQGRKPGQMEDEVFASKHRDVNSVACIEDKCYVLTYAEYCRYRANLVMTDITMTSSALNNVPEPPGGYPRRIRLPSGCVSPEMVFFCRSVYDFRQKRILKNPT